MTTFTPTTDLATAPLDPVTSELMTALKQNPEAITEGDSTAPRVSALALGPIFDSDQSISTDAGGTELVAIDIGASRKSVIQYSFFGTLNVNSEAGTSFIRLRGSDDDATWTTLDTIASAGATAADVYVLAGHDERGGTAYRYYQIFATGDSDHDLTGSAMISLMGTEDET